MWPDRISNPGPLTYESGALPTALRSPAALEEESSKSQWTFFFETQGTYIVLR